VALGKTGVAVTLLDPAKGHPIQTWEFNDRSQIRIGRGDGNDVVIGDPLVSRLHVELNKDPAGRWRVTSLGRNGTLVDGEPVVDSAPVRHGALMQLGANGPWMEFCEGQRASRGSETIAWSGASMEMPNVDQDLLHSEVSKIADGEQFKGLQQQAEEFKRSRGEDELA